MSALDGLRRRVVSFDDRATPYISWAAPQFIVQFDGDYDQLARLWEWHVIGENDDGAGRMNAIAPAQRAASDPAASVIVTANAGTGKTSTLVDRSSAARASPEARLVRHLHQGGWVAEMPPKLFDKLRGWAVLDDGPLAAEMSDLGERPSDLSAARALFARALETPGGLKIQTIHAFCEKLLRRFPLEAGVSPGFRVLEDAAARAVSARAWARVTSHIRALPIRAGGWAGPTPISRLSRLARLQRHVRIIRGAA